MANRTIVGRMSTNGTRTIALFGPPRNVPEGYLSSKCSGHLPYHINNTIQNTGTHQNVRIKELLSAYSPTCGPSGVLILTIDPAGTFHALPDRIGRMNSSSRTREADCKAA